MNYYNEIKNKLIDNEIYSKVKDYSKERHKVITYYETGKLLYEAGSIYGEDIIGQYSLKLINEVGKKYNKSTLFRMKQFYLVFSNEKVAPLAQQLSWSHYIELLPLKDENSDFSPRLDECDYANGNIKGLSEQSRNLIDNALWYLGGGDNNDSYYADDYYNMERNNSAYGNNLNRWIGMIGLIYPSDAAYATDLSLCKVTGYNYKSEGSNCATRDWLLRMSSNSTYMINPSLNDDFMVWRGGGGAGIFSSSVVGVGDGGDVFPVVYFKPNVKVTGGSGTNNNPYTLGIDE